MMQIGSLLQSLEESPLDPEFRRAPAAGDLLDEDFREFGSSGRICPKSEILAADVVLVTYRASRLTEEPVHSQRSSLWRLREGQWRMVFHQGTPVRP